MIFYLSYLILVVQSRNFYPLFLLREYCRYYLGKTEKASRATVFLYWQHWAYIGLIMPCIHVVWCYFHIVCFYFKKKKWGEIAWNFIFSCLGMSDIACIFTWYLNSFCINLLCLDMIESLWLYLPSFYCICKNWIAHFLMRWKCTLSKTPPKVHLSFFDLLLLEILNKRRGFW
jgi:hypothetical protein